MANDNAQFIQLRHDLIAIVVPDNYEWYVFNVDGQEYVNGINDDGVMLAGTIPLPGLGWLTHEPSKEDIRLFISNNDFPDRESLLFLKQNTTPHAE